jgi:hypothetical protein
MEFAAPMAASPATDLAGRSDLAGKETPEVLGSFDDRAIPRNVRHRAQCVELLGSRDPRHAVHREDRRAGIRQPLEQFGILAREQEAHERLRSLQVAPFITLGRTHFQDDVGF